MDCRQGYTQSQALAQLLFIIIIVINTINIIIILFNLQLYKQDQDFPYWMTAKLIFEHHFRCFCTISNAWDAV